MKNRNYYFIGKKPKWSKEWPDMNRYELAFAGYWIDEPLNFGEKFLRLLRRHLFMSQAGHEITDFLINWRFRLGITKVFGNRLTEYGYVSKK